VIREEIPFPNAFPDHVHREGKTPLVGLNHVGQPMLLNERSAERARPRPYGSAEYPVPGRADKQKSEDAHREQEDFAATELAPAWDQRVSGNPIDDALLLQRLDGSDDVRHCCAATFLGHQHVGPRVERHFDRLLEAGVKRMPP
jgi:hypothetical protein